MADGGIIPVILVAITALPGAVFWRQNTGAAKVAGQWVTFGIPGTPDILGCCRGRAIGIECKSAIGKQSLAQRRWQAAWELAGGIYILARSLDDVMRGIDVTS